MAPGSIRYPPRAGMTLSLFLAWVVVMALAIATYVWLVVVMLRDHDVPRDWRWSVLLPPVACVVAIRVGGWPRAAAILFVVLACTYGILRIVA